MKRFLSLTMCLAMVAMASVALAATTSGTHARDLSGYQKSADEPGSFLHSASSSQHAALRETAGPDTFILYGGPGSADGKFGTIVTPDRNGWDGFDLTDNPVFWHVSTFNSPTGTQAMWTGVEPSHPDGWSDGWVNAPGYGNGWDDALLYESGPIGADVALDQTVNLDFFFNYDMEGGYDFFTVEYDSAGTWTVAATYSGTNGPGGVFPVGGDQFSTSPQFTGPDGHPIHYDPNGYGGVNSDEIRIRLRFTSDGSYSDADGLNPTNGGGAEVDNITLSSTGGTLSGLSENYEVPAVPDPFTQPPVGTYLFDRDKAAWAGDFSDVYNQITSIDLCTENASAVIGFIDYGQVPSNSPGLDGTVSTGGSTSTTNYGIPGNYVVNYSGGLSNGLTPLINEVWSPDIFWDYQNDGPGVGDGADIAGCFFTYDIWLDLPIPNGIFSVWHVRSAVAGDFYGPWSDRNFVYYSVAGAVWGNSYRDVSDLLVSGPERVQVALGAWDYASYFGLPGGASTPAPVYDNFALKKYKLQGAVLSATQIRLANDGFPVNGALTFADQTQRDAMDIPFDMCLDVNSGDNFLVPGDSVVVDVESLIVGASVSTVKMYWNLKKNTFFEDLIRTEPAGGVYTQIVTGDPANFWAGTVAAQQSTTSSGQPVTGRWFFELPDVDFLYPGDHLEYYFEAVDTGGRTTTLPASTTGFGLHDNTFSRNFMVRGLPSVTDIGGTQPSVLVWDDGGIDQQYLNAFGQIGYVEGVDFDTYATLGSSSNVGNGIGSNTPTGGHGADPQQMVGYDSMFYFASNLDAGLFSDGSNAGSNDKGNDVNLLNQWTDQNSGAKNAAYFGDYVATGVNYDSAASQTYLQDVMGVDYQGYDVRPSIGGQQNALVQPSGNYGQFVVEFISNGGCLAVNEFDWIKPLTGASAGHLWYDPNTLAPFPETTVAASVVYDDPGSAGVGYQVTFPFALHRVLAPAARAGISPRAVLFAELLSLFGEPTSGGTVTSAPSRARAEMNVYPNPFNPSTQIEFANTRGLTGYVKVFNLRGELVRTLHTGEFQVESFRWDGTDNRGASVASGVYVVKGVAGDQVLTKKAALVK